MARKKRNNVAAVEDDFYGKVVREHSSDLTELDGKDTGIPDGENDSLIAVSPENLPVNVTLPCTIYMKSFGKIFVFRRQGEKINYKVALEMSKKGGTFLFVHKAFWDMFMQSLEALGESNDNSEAKTQHMRRLLLAYGMELEKKLKEPKKPMFEKLERLANSISDSIQRDPKTAATLLKPPSDPQFYFTNHSINSAVYATLIGIKQNYDASDIKKLTYATLVHDVGNLFLPKRILFKRSALSPDDRELMKTHPRKGAELLQSLKSPPEVVRSVLQHHERIDGAGYPEGLTGIEIHPFAKIIAIADAYDALTSNRPHCQAVTPKEALQKMLEAKGHYDQELLKVVDESAEKAKKSDPEKKDAA